MQDNIQGATIVGPNSGTDPFESQIQAYEKLLEDQNIDPEVLAQARLDLIQDAKQAIKAKTSAEAKRWYGYCLAFGDHGFPRNLDEGIKLLTEAVVMRSREANRYLGDIYSTWTDAIPEEKVDYEKAIKHYEQHDSGYSHYRLANIYANHSTLKDLRKALDSIEKSAVTYSHVRGKCLLAVWTYEGEFVSQDFEKAYKLFQDVYEEDKDEYDDFGRFSKITAMAYMGLMLYHGEGVVQDEQRGFNLLEKSAELGDENAIAWIHDYYTYSELPPL